MPETDFEKTLNELLRRGNTEKVKILQSLEKKIMPSQIQRILRNDKSVLQEIVLPKWLNWNLLQLWAQKNYLEETGNFCTLCNEKKENGIKFKDKFICENCFKEIKTISNRTE